jgi:nicotinamidase-related amidase
MTHSYDSAKTAFVLVDPYNDFFAEDGKIYPQLGYSVTLAKDATAAFTREWTHAAVELNGPLYAEVLTTTDVTARIKD